MSYTKLDIKELQNRLDAISEAQVNEDFDDMSPDELRNAALRKLDIISRD